MDDISVVPASSPARWTCRRRSVLLGGAAAILAGCGGGKTSPGSTAAPAGPTLNTNIDIHGGPPIVRPHARWTGAAGTGFTVVPRDPVRTTAKAAARLLIVPKQRFTDTKLIGVIAMANDGGSLFTNFGLEKVVVHFEGGRVEIREPSIEKFRDANGQDIAYAGWWARLGKDERVGEGHVYFEAVPRDTTMQKRVIGPYSFFPAETEFDMELEVARGLPEIAGRRFASCKRAVLHAVASGSQHPRIQLAQSGDYFANFWLAPVGIAGWVTIEASPGVSARFVQHDFPSEADTPRMATGVNTCFRGAGITLDFRSTMELHSGEHVEYWFDGCNLENSAGSASLWRKLPRAILGFTVRGKPWHTESRISNLFNPLDKVTLARGVVTRDTCEDFAQGASCVIGCSSTRHSNDHHRTYRPAITIFFTGTGKGSIESAAPGKTITFKEDGRVVATMPLSGTAAAFMQSPEGSPAGTYHVSNLAAWINSSIPNWHAQLHDDSRAGVALSLADGRAAQIPPTIVDGDGLQLFTHFDLHGDYYQRADNAEVENVIFYGNRAVGGSFQTLFMGSGSSGYMRDAFFVNNAWHHDPASPFFAEARMGSFGGNPSHVVILHNTVAGQGVRLTDPAQSAIGTHNLFAANVAAHMTLSGIPLVQVEICDNHLETGARVPEGATGTLVGGSVASLFADAGNGDFSARGELLQTQAPSRVPFDIDGARRPGMSPRGASL